MGHFNKLYDKNYQPVQDTKLKYGYTDSWGDYNDYLQVYDILNEELNNKVRTTADRLIGVVDQEIMDSHNPVNYS